MADKKISQLTGATTPLAGTEVLPIVQGGNTVKVSVDNLTKGKTVNAATFDTDVAAAAVTLTGTTLAADGTDTNIDINITPKGTGEVNLPKVDIDGGAIDGTTIGANSAGDATFNTANVGALNWSSKLVVSGNGSIPGASELAIGTNGVGSRLVFNIPTGGEFNFSQNGVNCIAISSTVLAPLPNNTLSLGNGSLRWTEVFAINGTINTSDAREKQQVSSLNDAEKAVALKIKSLFKTFKFNDAVAKKGSEARTHVGVLAQDVKVAFESEGLKAENYGLFCYDEWPDKWADELETKTVIENGNETIVTAPTGKKVLEIAAGNSYGIRYEQLLAFVIAAI